MNKAFEKILERMDKPQFDIGCGACPNKEKCDEVQENINDEKTDLCAETMRYIAKEIVQEVAEEYNITNGDKIRYMNDDELAEFLVNFKNTYGDEYEGEMSCLDWLKSEADN